MSSVVAYVALGTVGLESGSVPR